VAQALAVGLYPEHFLLQALILVMVAVVVVVVDSMVAAGEQALMVVVPAALAVQVAHLDQPIVVAVVVVVAIPAFLLVRFQHQQAVQVDQAWL
jgi:hypothetical protein